MEAHVELLQVGLFNYIQGRAIQGSVDQFVKGLFLNVEVKTDRI